MSDQDTPRPPEALSPQQELVIQTAAEAAFLPEHEREEQRNIVKELIGEMASQGAMDFEERQQLLVMFDENIRLARGENREATGPLTASVDLNKIDWLVGKDIREFPAEEVTTDRLTYKYVDLTPYNKTTEKCATDLADQTVAGTDNLLGKLTGKLKEISLTQLHDSIKSGGGVRHLSRGGTKGGANNIDTDYPAYKLGLHGTNNRAVILLIDNQDIQPTFALAAIYDHDDEGDIFRTLGLGRPKA